MINSKAMNILKISGIVFAVFLFIGLIPQPALSAPQMGDYCYLPPFVTDPNTPPNIMITLDKTSWGMNRAYKNPYDSTRAYYGFFDASSKYTYNGTAFIKTTDANCTTQLTAANKYNCFPGSLLNWALMSSLDLTKKAMIGYGYVSTSQNTGDLFTYTGALTAKGLVNDTTVYGAGNNLCSVSFAGGTYSYYFGLTNPTGSNNKPAKVTINVKPYTAPADCLTSSACTGTCKTPVSNQEIGMTYNGESRIGIYQKYADKNRDYYDDYPNTGARFGMVRWKTGSGGDKGIEIFDDSVSVTAANKNEFFKSFLNVSSSSPPTDPGGNPLGSMMHDLVNYFSNNASYSTHSSDSSSYTQSPYDWTKDPAASCRKNFALFITSGQDLTDASPLSSTCPNNTDTYRTAFSQDACYGYTTDLSAVTGNQIVRTYVVHTVSGIACTASVCTHNGNACTTNEDCTNEEKLKYAALKGGGEYIKVDRPEELESKIEEAILNILASSASASTVATLTTQTRESSTLTQAYFYPRREGTELKWTGYLRLLWSDKSANLREDTMNSAWLDLKKDKILSFYFDSSAVKYKARLYDPKLTPADEESYLKINSCDPLLATTKENDDVTAIWNAQSKLQARTTDDRTIKIGIGASGKCSNNDATSCTSDSDCTSPGVCQFVLTGSQMYDFTTARASTLQPFWNYASYCSNYPSRWCATDANCNYCTALRGTYSIDRGCSSASDCQYCDGNKALSCDTTLTCSDGSAAACATAGDSCNAGLGVCVGDCYKYAGTCNTGGSLVCDVDDTTACAGLGTACTVSSVTGTCKAKCTLDTTRLCLNNNPEPDADNCVDDYRGSAALSGCVTTDTCTSAAAGTCVQECDSANCATSVIKYVRGHDKPTPSGSLFRIRHDPEVATTDNLATLKLGDIVYSSPRISPNSAVNGYDIVYQDTSYSNFIDSKIKGKNPCSSDADCPETQTCGLISGLCSGGGYTPIVVVGANDGMVHAFKVSKIKDVNPASANCNGDVSCGAVADGYQTARFSDKPNDSSDTAPPSDIGKELWAYIPFNAVPYLKWYCSDAYCHIPMVDARFTVVDVSIDYDNSGTVDVSDSDALATSARTKDSWRRLVIGAMGVGGKQITVGSNTWSSSIFVLDITNPESPKLLWERPLPDGTLTTSNPAIVRLASSAALTTKTENGKWYLVIGSGPQNISTNSVTYKTSAANIYVFDLRNGNLEATISTGATGVAVGDFMAVDMDSDYQVDVIYFGTYGGTGATQTGNFYRMRLRSSAGPSGAYLTPANWVINTAVSAGRPIYAGTTMSLDASARKWIYFGTGLYLALEHASPTAYCSNAATTSCAEDSDCSAGGTCNAVAGYQEYLYGFKENDSCWQDGTGTCTYSNFLDTTNISFTGAKAVQLGCFCAGNLLSIIDCNPSTGSCPSSCGTGEDTVALKVTDATISGTGVPAACSGSKDEAAIDCLETVVNSTGCGGSGCNGWKRTLTGQKVFSKPFVAGGLVDFTSFQPTATVCSLGGNTLLGALHYTTGTSYIQPAILMSGGTSGATSSLTIRAFVNLGAGVPPLGESLVALPLSGDTYKVITQVSGSLPGTQMGSSVAPKSGYVLWITK